MASKENITEITDKIFALDVNNIPDERREKIFDFLETTINGDTVKDNLVISASFNKKKGVAVYVLTDVRLVKINILAEEDSVKSSSFFINKLKVEWSLSDGDKSTVKVSAQDEYFNLAYSKKEITDFFKKVDKARIQAEAQNG